MQITLTISLTAAYFIMRSVEERARSAHVNCSPDAPAFSQHTPRTPTRSCCSGGCRAQAASRAQAARKALQRRCRPLLYRRKTMSTTRLSSHRFERVHTRTRQRGTVCVHSVCACAQRGTHCARVHARTRQFGRIVFVSDRSIARARSLTGV